MITKNLKLASLLIGLLAISPMLRAEITLPAIFGNHMVLQQQTDAPIWGKATPNTTVKVTASWDNETYDTQSDANGQWKIKVKTPSAGGPYDLTISDGTTLKLNNVLIGEVWICSGQSNMQMPMKGYRNQPILGSNEAVATSSNPSTFDHADNGLATFGKSLENFKVAGENQRFYPAEAFITREGITLFSPTVEKPVAVHYAFEDFVVGELYNTEGLPASSFRTDDWEK